MVIKDQPMNAYCIGGLAYVYYKETPSTGDVLVSLRRGQLQVGPPRGPILIPLADPDLTEKAQSIIVQLLDGLRKSNCW